MLQSENHIHMIYLHIIHIINQIFKYIFFLNKVMNNLVTVLQKSNLN